MPGGKGKSSGGKSSGGKTSAGAEAQKKQMSHSERAGLQVRCLHRCSVVCDGSAMVSRRLRILGPPQPPSPAMADFDAFSHLPRRLIATTRADDLAKSFHACLDDAQAIMAPTGWLAMDAHCHATEP